MPEDKEQQSPQFMRHENYETWYANNVQYHPSEWDLKLVFGELDSRDGNVIIQQHTAISVAWLQAKIMHYFLTVQLGVFEMGHGKIPVPTSVAPIEPTPPTGEMANDPFAKRVYEYIKKAREEFMAAQSQ